MNRLIVILAITGLFFFGQVSFAQGENSGTECGTDKVAVDDDGVNFVIGFAEITRDVAGHPVAQVFSTDTNDKWIYVIHIDPMRYPTESDLVVICGAPCGSTGDKVFSETRLPLLAGRDLLPDFRHAIPKRAWLKSAVVRVPHEDMMYFWRNAIEKAIRTGGTTILFPRETMVFMKPGD